MSYELALLYSGISCAEAKLYSLDTIARKLELSDFESDLLGGCPVESTGKIFDVIEGLSHDEFIKVYKERAKKIFEEIDRYQSAEDSIIESSESVISRSLEVGETDEQGVEVSISLDIEYFIDSEPLEGYVSHDVVKSAGTIEDWLTTICPWLHNYDFSIDCK
ncbi:hypothetical protein CGJ26_11110 [Vibrio parahaemolyticus]|uniref:hypothetical protein n=1 Tax=Vibrio parahaemolyticus TaxID=670 RepID=UPI0011216015|nr:hypothetical protein [Vibrio parahaemolyticus]TOF21207.1 hypothetical protein CGJ26_11110 [Vibrio parahaemolyticus]